MDDTRDRYKQFHRRRHQMLLDLLGKHVPARTHRCLDIGGGGDVAGMVDVVKERFAQELYTVDLATDTDRVRALGIMAEVCNVDQSPLPYENAFFDIVVFASLLEHLYNPRRVVDEIARTLKPGGVLLLETPNALALGRRLDALTGHNPFARFNQYNALENKAIMEYCSVFYTLDEVCALLAPRFTIEDCRHGMHDPPANPVKRAIREAMFLLNPRMGDCFFVIARRKA